MGCTITSSTGTVVQCDTVKEISDNATSTILQLAEPLAPYNRALLGPNLGYSFSGTITLVFYTDSASSAITKATKCVDSLPVQTWTGTHTITVDGSKIYQGLRCRITQVAPTFPEEKQYAEVRISFSVGDTQSWDAYRDASLARIPEEPISESETDYGIPAADGATNDPLYVPGNAPRQQPGYTPPPVSYPPGTPGGPGGPGSPTGPPCIQTNVLPAWANGGPKIDPFIALLVNTWNYQIPSGLRTIISEWTVSDQQVWDANSNITIKVDWNNHITSLNIRWRHVYRILAVGFEPRTKFYLSKGGTRLDIGSASHSTNIHTDDDYAISNPFCGHGITNSQRMNGSNKLILNAWGADTKVINIAT